MKTFTCIHIRIYFLFLCILLILGISCGNKSLGLVEIGIKEANLENTSSLILLVDEDWGLLKTNELELIPYNEISINFIDVSQNSKIIVFYYENTEIEDTSFIDYFDQLLDTPTLVIHPTYFSIIYLENESDEFELKYFEDAEDEVKNISNHIVFETR